MLKLRYLFGNFDLAKEALRQWAHDTDSLDEMLKGFRVSSNAIYPFRNDNEICYLRLAPVTEKLENNVMAELEFITYLASKDYPALVPIPSTSGKLLETIDTQWGKYYAAAFHGVGGTRIDQTDMSNNIMLEYGRTLGRLHRLSSEFAPKTRKWDHNEVLQWIETTLIEYEAPAVLFIELADITNQLAKLSRNPDNYGLVHYDFEPDNVFYEPIKSTCAVIDFDDGMYHWFALDLEQAMDSLAEELAGEQLEIAKEKFVEGYRTEFALTEESDASYRLMRRFVDLYKYARLIRCLDDQFDEEPDWMVWLRNKLHNVMLELESSMTARNNLDSERIK